MAKTKSSVNGPLYGAGPSPCLLLPAAPVPLQGGNRGLRPVRPLAPRLLTTPPPLLPFPKPADETEC